MIIFTTILASLVALIDVFTTYRVIKKQSVSVEQGPIAKFLYTKIKRSEAAALVHLLIWLGFLSLPHIFTSGGIIIGNLLFIALVGILVKRNIEKL